MQIDFLDANAVVAGRLDARNIIDKRGHLPFVNRQDAVLNILRVHAVICPNDTNDRNIDFRKNIHRHARGGADTQQAY